MDSDYLDLPPSKSAKVTGTPSADDPLAQDTSDHTGTDGSTQCRQDATLHQLPRGSRAISGDETPTITFKTDTDLIKEHRGDFFTAPDNTVLVHACNTVGSWGGGIAAAFRQRYPKAYQIYKKHCTQEHDTKINPVPRGTCLLIPPVETKPGPKHWIGCLFTSAKYGKEKDPPHVILRHTGPAFKDLLSQLASEPTIEEVRMCQINAGLFAVPWNDTKEEIMVVLTHTNTRKEVHVYTPASLPTSPNPVNRKANPVNRKPTLEGQSAMKGQATLYSYVTKKQSKS